MDENPSSARPLGGKGEGGEPKRCVLESSRHVVSAADSKGDVERLVAIADSIGLGNGDAVEQSGVRLHLGAIDDGVAIDGHVRAHFGGDGDLAVADLLEIRWWDWPREKIARNLTAIQEGRTGELK